MVNWRGGCATGMKRVRPDWWHLYCLYRRQRRPPMRYDPEGILVKSGLEPLPGGLRMPSLMRNSQLCAAVHA